MDWFETKKALLTYLGKNPDDRKLVDRLIAKWEVWVENGMYYVNEEKREEKSEVKEEIVVDDKELKELKDKNEKLMNAYKKERDRNLVYRWMYDHLVFFYNKFLWYKKFVEWKVFWQAEHNKSLGTQDTMETVRPDVYKRYNFEFWEVEEEECKAVEAIINERGKELAEIPF